MNKAIAGAAAGFFIGCGIPLAVNFWGGTSRSPLLLVSLVVPILGGTAGYAIGILIDRLASLERKSREHIASLERESRNIIDHIDAAICTINRDYTIDALLNRNILRLFGEKNYGGTSIFENIFYILEGSVKQELKEFLATAFDSLNASDDMLNSANPVASFTYVYNEGGEVVHKSIRASVIRIFDENKKISRLMFIFNDVSLEEKLGKDQSKREREIEDQYGKITAMLNNDRTVIIQFLDDLEKKVAELKSLFQEGSGNDGHAAFLSRSLRLVHTLKGEAFSLGFETLTGLLKRFEHFLQEAIKGDYGMEAQLELVMFFEKIENEKKSLRKIIDKLRGFVQEVTAFGNPDALDTIGRLQLLEKELQKVCEKSAETEKKSIRFELRSDVKQIPDTVFSSFKDILVHLVRNSAAHGIEDPITRIREGKPQQGTAYATISRDSSFFLLEYGDDGHGFDVSRIRRRAVASGLIPQDKADTMKDGDLIPLVFRDGFSTAESGGDVAGVGVGMAVVKDLIMNRLNGRISLTNKPGKGIILRMKVPVNAGANGDGAV